MIVWGKREYGAVNKVGNVSVKTVFGHLYYMPLFPMSSYYVDKKSKSFYELNSINWRSAGCAYLRMWLALPTAFSVLMLVNPEASLEVLAGPAIMAAVGLTALIGSYVLDKKFTEPHSVQIRSIMERHFGVALDPYECMTSMQIEVNQRIQAHRGAFQEEHWYRQALTDLTIARNETELAILRARCEQHDKPLQQVALQALARIQH